MSQISDLGTPPLGAHGSPAALCRTNPPPLQRSSRRIPRRDTRPPQPWQSDPAGWLAHKHRLILQGRNALLKARGSRSTNCKDVWAMWAKRDWKFIHTRGWWRGASPNSVDSKKNITPVQSPSIFPIPVQPLPPYWTAPHRPWRWAHTAARRFPATAPPRALPPVTPRARPRRRPRSPRWMPRTAPPDPSGHSCGATAGAAGAGARAGAGAGARAGGFAMEATAREV